MFGWRPRSVFFFKFFCYILTCIYIYIYMLHHNDTINKQTSEDFFRKICTSHFIVRVRKGLLRVLQWEGVGDRTELQYIDTHSYGRQRCVFLVLLMLNRRLSFLLSAGFLYHILSPTGLRNYWGPRGPLRPGVAFPTTSYQQLLWSPTLQGLQGPLPPDFLYQILSATRLISNSSGFQLNWGPRGPLRPGVAFPTTSRLLLQPSDFLSWLSYIIVQRPLNLWNGMFDRHQAEITVMQFRGHSLPVHQSMSVSWDFLPCPISSAKSAHAISFDYWPLECATSFRRIALEWHVCPGRRSKYSTFREDVQVFLLFSNFFYYMWVKVSKKVSHTSPSSFDLFLGRLQKWEKLQDDLNVSLQYLKEKTLRGLQPNMSRQRLAT